MEVNRLLGKVKKWYIAFGFFCCGFGFGFGLDGFSLTLPIVTTICMVLYTIVCGKNV